MKIVSLFANVGIAELYLQGCGCEVVVANEIDPKRVAFYKYLHPSTTMICGDITKKAIFNKVLHAAQAAECSLLLATPPCQGMSSVGKMLEDDPRNTLIKYVVSMAQALQPRYILIENVPQMLKSYIIEEKEKIAIVSYIAKHLTPLGYIMNAKVINCADYGVAQNRKRTIILLAKDTLWRFPKKQRHKSVYDAIGDLPSLESGEVSSIPFHYAKVHNPHHIEVMRHTPTGKSALENKHYYPKKKDGTPIRGYETTYKRMEWNKPAPTVTMYNGYISSQNNVHPGRKIADGIYSDARVLSLKEIFCISSLPETFTPPTWASENFVREVIGEGIPPLVVRNLIEGIDR